MQDIDVHPLYQCYARLNLIEAISALGPLRPRHAGLSSVGPCYIQLTSLSQGVNVKLRDVRNVTDDDFLKTS
jgi:hypothetical protein